MPFPQPKPVSVITQRAGTNQLAEAVTITRSLRSQTLQETTAGTLHLERRFRPLGMSSLPSAAVAEFDHPFKWVKTSPTAGTLYHGFVWLKGVSLTASGWTNHGTGANLSLSSLTSTTYGYFSIDLSAATATWATNTSGFPASTATVLVKRIITITCASSIISAVKVHHTSDVDLPGNV